MKTKRNKEVLSSESSSKQAQCIVAVDPGASGGIAVANYGAVMAEAFSEATMPELVRRLANGAGCDTYAITCYIERVGGYIGKEQPGSHMFTFGEAYGFARGIMVAHGIPVVLVEPKAWLRAVAPGTLGMPYEQRKKALAALAASWHPELGVTRKTADALGILRYATQRPGSVAIPHPSEYSGDLKRFKAWCKAEGHKVPEGAELLRAVTWFRKQK